LLPEAFRERTCDHRRPVCRNRQRRVAGGSVPQTGGVQMNILYWLAGGVALLLFIYLLIALFCAEEMS